LAAARCRGPDTSRVPKAHISDHALDAGSGLGRVGGPQLLPARGLTSDTRAGVKGPTSARYLFQNGNPAPGAPFAERARQVDRTWVAAHTRPRYSGLRVRPCRPFIEEKYAPNRSAAATFLVVPHSSLPAA